MPVKIDDILEFINSMRNGISERIDIPLSRFADRSKQMLLCNAIRYIDYMFEKDTIGISSISKRTADIIEFGFPLLLRTIKLEDEQLEGMMLLPSSDEMKQQVEMIMDEFYIAGLLETCKSYVHCGLLEGEAIDDKKLVLKFKETYHFMERLDKISTATESNNALYRLMPYNLMMAEGAEPVLKMMDELYYVWNHDFIGYGADEDVDQFYIDNAIADLIQDTEWDVFGETDTFGGIEYNIFIDAIMYLEMLALKHLQFVNLAVDKHKTIDMFNILPVMTKRAVICEDLSDFLSIDIETAETIFSMFSVKQSQMGVNYEKYLALPPYIEMAKDYYIRSLAGCLYEPASYLLSRLRDEFPRDWDINIQKREERFRSEIYEFFSDNFYIKHSKNIIIKDGEKVLTDIDGAIYDKNSGYICFIQLKWQDTIYDSFKSMLSKKTNYVYKVEQWLDTMRKWIESASEETIANYLHMRPGEVDKSKIRLIVVGRFNGRYSTSEKNNKECVYCQWFELKRILTKYSDEISEGGKTLDDIYKILENEMQGKEEAPVMKSGITDGDKTIVYDGLLYNEA